MLLLRQRYDIDLLLRQMAQELRITEHGQEVAYRNTPADRPGYAMFRRVVTHLSAIQDQNQLYAEPLVFTRTWTIPANSVTAEGFQALEKEYLVTYSQRDNTCTLRKHITGHQVSHNPFLMAEGLTINPDALSINELRERAWQVVEPQYQARLATLADECAAAKAKGLGSDDLAQVAKRPPRGGWPRC